MLTTNNFYINQNFRRLDISPMTLYPHRVCPAVYYCKILCDYCLKKWYI